MVPFECAVNRSSSVRHKARVLDLHARRVYMQRSCSGARARARFGPAADKRHAVRANDRDQKDIYPTARMANVTRAIAGVSRICIMPVIRAARVEISRGDLLALSL